MRVRNNLGLLLEQMSDLNTQPRVFQRLGIVAVVSNSAFYPKGSVKLHVLIPSFGEIDEGKIPLGHTVLVS